jgi:hypothetical protein
MTPFRFLQKRSWRLYEKCLHFMEMATRVTLMQACFSVILAFAPRVYITKSGQSWVVNTPPRFPLPHSRRTPRTTASLMPHDFVYKHVVENLAFSASTICTPTTVKSSP